MRELQIQRHRKVSEIFVTLVQCKTFDSEQTVHKYIRAATWQNQPNECAPSEDSDQPGHPPSLIRVFAVRMKKAWVLSYSLSAQRRPWSDWADVQADLSRRWAHTHFVGFVKSRQIHVRHANRQVELGWANINTMYISRSQSLRQQCSKNRNTHKSWFVRLRYMKFYCFSKGVHFSFFLFSFFLVFFLSL